MNKGNVYGNPKVRFISPREICWDRKIIKLSKNVLDKYLLDLTEKM